MKKISEYLNYVIFAVIVVFAAIYFSEARAPKVKPISQVEAIDVDQVVNKFLKQTSDQTSKEDLAFRKALEQQLRKPLNIKREDLEVRPEEIPAERQIWKEDFSSHTPAESIQSEIYNQEAFAQQDELDKKEYARQFIENARQGGYHVVLSPDNKVISVTPIRKPTQNEDSTDLFPAN